MGKKDIDRADDNCQSSGNKNPAVNLVCMRTGAGVKKLEKQVHKGPYPDGMPKVNFPDQEKEKGEDHHKFDGGKK